MADSAQVTVDVIAQPAILGFTATPTVASTQGGTVQPPIQLEWTTQNGVTLQVERLRLWPAMDATELCGEPLQRADDHAMLPSAQREARRQHP